jgi:hypothetical protein
MAIACLYVYGISVGCLRLCGDPVLRRMQRACISIVSSSFSSAVLNFACKFAAKQSRKEFATAALLGSRLLPRQLFSLPRQRSSRAQALVPALAHTYASPAVRTADEDREAEPADARGGDPARRHAADFAEGNPLEHMMTGSPMSRTLPFQLI